MTRIMLLALAATTTLSGGLSLFFGQGSSVSLQPSTPGTQQVGNANVSGRIIAGSIHVTDPSPTGQAIVGSATSTTGANFGGFFRSDSPLGRALYGRASALSGTTHGVWGQADSPGGRGVTGLAPATSGNATGVWGQTASTTGRGVYGYSTAVSGESYGVFGQSSSPEGFGIYSQGNLHATGVISGNGSGITNVNAAQLGGNLASAFLKTVPNPLTLEGNTGGHIIQGKTTSVAFGSTGVSGSSLGATGTTYGVRGSSNSTSGRGVVAVAGASSGSTYGLYAQCFSSTGTGVVGAIVGSSGSNYGVHGISNSLSGFGVYASGRFGASGTKSFRIDHPLDPENKYLMHYSTESPTPQNFYVGNVVTDTQGYAWVDLPDYFSEINANFKYQLTVVGKTFAQAVVWEKIKGNRFQIRTNEPNIEVSWRIDADRNDLFVRNRPSKDVVEKEGREQGTYQHPEFYGFGPERGMNYDGERQKTQNPPAKRVR